MSKKYLEILGGKSLAFKYNYFYSAGDPETFFWNKDLKIQDLFGNCVSAPTARQHEQQVKKKLNIVSK